MLNKYTLLGVSTTQGKMVKLVAIKLRRNTSFWWKNLKKLREREGKRKITTWDKMKKELKRKYLPIDYKQEFYHKLHNLKQKELSVDEYTAHDVRRTSRTRGAKHSKVHWGVKV